MDNPSNYGDIGGLVMLAHCIRDSRLTVQLLAHFPISKMMWDAPFCAYAFNQPDLIALVIARWPSQYKSAHLKKLLSLSWGNRNHLPSFFHQVIVNEAVLVIILKSMTAQSATLELCLATYQLANQTEGEPAIFSALKNPRCLALVLDYFSQHQGLMVKLLLTKNQAGTRFIDAIKRAYWMRMVQYRMRQFPMLHHLVEQHTQPHALELLELIANQSPSYIEVTNYASLKQRATQVDFSETITQVLALEPSKQSFQDDLAEILSQRDKSHPGTCLSLIDDIDSPTSQFLWHLGQWCFNGQATMGQMIGLLMPSVSERVTIDACAALAHGPKRMKRNRIELVLESKPLIAWAQPAQHPDLLAQCVVADGRILFAPDMARLSFELHEQLATKLDSTYPNLGAALYEHKHHLSTLAMEIDLIQSRGRTPREWLHRLLAKLEYRVSIYSNEDIMDAETSKLYELFVKSCRLFPSGFRQRLEEVKGLTYQQNLAEVLYNMGHGGCSHESIKYLRDIADKPSDADVLDIRPELSEAYIARVKAQYRHHTLETLCYSDTRALPDRLYAGCLASIVIHKPQFLLDLLLLFPPVLYGDLFAHAKFQFRPKVPNLLLQTIQEAHFFYQEQKDAIDGAIAQHYDKLDGMMQALVFAIRAKRVPLLTKLTNRFKQLSNDAQRELLFSSDMMNESAVMYLFQYQPAFFLSRFDKSLLQQFMMTPSNTPGLSRLNVLIQTKAGRDCIFQLFDTDEALFGLLTQQISPQQPAFVFFNRNHFTQPGTSIFTFWKTVLERLSNNQLCFQLITMRDEQTPSLLGQCQSRHKLAFLFNNIRPNNPAFGRILLTLHHRLHCGDSDMASVAIALQPSPKAGTFFNLQNEVQRLTGKLTIEDAQLMYDILQQLHPKPEKEMVISVESESATLRA